MKSPFPGMDPFIEMNPHWDGFHDWYIRELVRLHRPVARDLDVWIDVERTIYQTDPSGEVLMMLGSPDLLAGGARALAATGLLVPVSMSKEAQARALVERELARERQRRQPLVPKTPGGMPEETPAGAAGKGLAQALARVPAVRPDVTVVHAQRADRQGNVQLWGLVGVQKEAVLAADRALATVEEVVDVLDRRPGDVIIPGWALDLVAVAPGGAAPSYAHGYYERDNDAYVAWDAISRDRDRFSAWLADNGLPGVDREADAGGGR